MSVAHNHEPSDDGGLLTASKGFGKLPYPIHDFHAELILVLTMFLQAFSIASDFSVAHEEPKNIETHNVVIQDDNIYHTKNIAWHETTFWIQYRPNHADGHSKAVPIVSTAQAQAQAQAQENPSATTKGDRVLQGGQRALVQY
ncbi:hypothetical protein ZTR_05793 [Talaromyces verruculosus]|nr:hypothetical protein ZTR_05793 [Talaromyces verruculosus]